MIKVGSGVSTEGNPTRAAEEALEQAMLPLDPARIRLGFLFMSPHHAIVADDVLGTILPRLEGATLLGCTSQGTVGGEHEIEQGPALSLWLAQLDGATVEPFELSVQVTPDGAAVVGLPLIPEPMRAMILLADPYSFPTQLVLDSLNTDYARLPVLGGQISGRGPGQNLLILNGRARTSGAVGVLLGGDFNVRPLVSQGCKPIGEPFVVTGVEGNVIWQLGGKPPLQRLRETLERLSPEDRAMASQNLHLGVVIDEHTVDPKPGDFLIRGVLQADPQTGAMSVGESLTLGQTVQFQVRDAATADADLRGLLDSRIESAQGSPAGALMFTCNGRGMGLFGAPNHDVAALRSAFAGLPVAGMFCGGEIGPIGGVNFLHGFTASVALFEEPKETPLGGLPRL
jgi:small ligand-binding sensory domain FIST